MSLYLKYRPLDFSSVVSQTHIISVLKSQFSKGNLGNNYLFFGPRGTGKTSTARILARLMNCLNPSENGPCNECESCRSILDDRAMDVVEIDAASHTGVDNIRQEIIEKATYTPSSLKSKVYIIDEVHMLSKGAFNALLKIMEEPPTYLTFILATTEINKVPDTIISRCQVFNFKKFAQDDIVGRLEYICKEEGFDYDLPSLALIADFSDGVMRDAIKYLEQVSVFGNLNSETVSKFLGVVPEKNIHSFLDLFRDFNYDDFDAFVNELISQGVDMSVMVKQILVYVDKHFNEDIDFYSMIAKVFSDISIGLKGSVSQSLTMKSNVYTAFASSSVSNSSSSILEDSELIRLFNKFLTENGVAENAGDLSFIEKNTTNDVTIGIVEEGVVKSIIENGFDKQFEVKLLENGYSNLILKVEYISQDDLI